LLCGYGRVILADCITNILVSAKRAKGFEIKLKCRRTDYPISYAGGYMRMETGYPFMAKKELLGHSGSTGSFAFYAPKQGIYYVGDVSQFASPAIPIRFVMKLALAVK
jgi:D-alanyl-D-alanine carboxypeptidase